MATQDAPVDVSIAINPNNLEAVPGLVREINEGVKTLATGGHEARHELIVKARSLMLALEAPRETMIKHCWAQVRQYGKLYYRMCSYTYRCGQSDRRYGWH